jgi:hypothetical protein
MGADFPNIGSTATIPIQLRAVSLESIAPVNIPGMGLFDLRVIGGDLIGGPSSALGTMTIIRSDANGGNFISSLPVSANLSFTPVPGNPNSPFTMAFSEVFGASGLWSFTPSPGDVHTDEMPPFPAGGFFAGVDPVTNQRATIGEMSPGAFHPADPSVVPEPNSLVLLGIGVLGLGVYTRRHRKQVA